METADITEAFFPPESYIQIREYYIILESILQILNYFTILLHFKELL